MFTIESWSQCGVTHFSVATAQAELAYRLYETCLKECIEPDFADTDCGFVVGFQATPSECEAFLSAARGGLSL